MTLTASFLLPAGKEIVRARHVTPTLLLRGLRQAAPCQQQCKRRHDGKSASLHDFPLVSKWPLRPTVIARD